MKYEVRIKISYCKAFFEFEDINEAASFMATAVEKLSGEENSDKVDIYMAAVKEEDHEETD